MYRDREFAFGEFADPPVVPQQLADFGLLEIFNAGVMPNQCLHPGGQLLASRHPASQSPR